MNFGNAATFNGASITVAGINATASATIGTNSGTISNFNNGVITIDVGTGATLDFGSQSFTSSGTAGYIKNGSGVLALGGNSYGGGFTLNSGTVIIRGVNAMGNGGALNLNGGIVASNANRDLSGRYAGGITIGGNIQFGATSGLASTSANLTFNNNMSLGSANRVLTMGNNGTVTFGGIISNSGSNGITFDSVSGGMFVLSGANIYGGNTVIGRGTVRTGVNSALPSGTHVTVGTSGATSNPGKLDLNGTSQTIASLTLLGGGNSTANSGSVDIGSGGVLTVNGAINYETGSFGNWPSTIAGGTLNLGGATRTITVHDNGNGTTGGDLMINSVIANGGITKEQGGILTLGGANTFSGTTTVNAGTLRLSHDDALQNSTLNTGSSGTQQVTFHVPGNTYNLGGLAGSDALALGISSIAVGANGADTTYSGAISSTGGEVIKNGSGSLTLAGANTYIGNTIVNGGKLIVSSAGLISSGSSTSFSVRNAGSVAQIDGTLITGAVTANTGTTLQGTGTVRATTAGVTVASGATLSPGNSIGTLTIGSVGNLTKLALNGTLDWEVNSSALTADITVVNGNMTLGSGSILNLIQLGSFAAGQKFTVMAYSGTLTGTFSNIASLTNWTINYADNTAGSNGSGGGGSNFITLTAVPEIGSMTMVGMIGFVTAVGLGWKRRRR